MKNPSVAPLSIRGSVIIVRARDIELDAEERAELHRAEVALGHVFRRIHRIEWKVVALPLLVEVRCEIRSLSGVFAAGAKEATTRAAIQAVTQQVLKQKRRDKETRVSRRRVTPKRPRSRA
ncbi:MAG: hypothetical protein ABI565_12925 [Vicinamibacteria bacterium]